MALESILTSTKKLVGLAEDYTAFDMDVTIFINACLGTLNQLGVGPDGGIQITDATDTWDLLAASIPLTELCQSYVYLKVRMLFDPPLQRFPIQAMEEQLAEMEWRIHAMVDDAEAIPVVEPTRPVQPGPDPNEEEWWALLP